MFRYITLLDFIDAQAKVLMSGMSFKKEKKRNVFYIFETLNLLTPRHCQNRKVGKKECLFSERIKC